MVEMKKMTQSLIGHECNLAATNVMAMKLIKIIEDNSCSTSNCE